MNRFFLILVTLGFLHSAHTMEERQTKKQKTEEMYEVDIAHGIYDKKRSPVVTVPIQNTVITEITQTTRDPNLFVTIKAKALDKQFWDHFLQSTRDANYSKETVEQLNAYVGKHENKQSLICPLCKKEQKRNDRNEPFKHLLTHIKFIKVSDLDYISKKLFPNIEEENNIKTFSYNTTSLKKKRNLTPKPLSDKKHNLPIIFNINPISTPPIGRRLLLKEKGKILKYNSVKFKQVISNMGPKIYQNVCNFISASEVIRSKQTCPFCTFQSNCKTLNAHFQHLASHVQFEEQPNAINSYFYPNQSL